MRNQNLSFAITEDIKKLKQLILLDNQSTINLFCDATLLTNIKTTRDTCTVVSTGGTTVTNQQGYLKNFGYVWYSPKAITNILSLAKVEEKFKVTYENETFKVHAHNKVIEFPKRLSGLYAFELDTTSAN